MKLQPEKGDTFICQRIIPLRPISLNNAYINVGRKRTLSPEARKWKKDVAWCVGDMPHCLKTFVDTELGIHFEFFYPPNDYYTKSGEPKRPDVDNLSKLALDVIAERIGIDDKRFTQVFKTKVCTTKKVGFQFTIWHRGKQDEI